MGYSVQGPKAGRWVWLLVISILALCGCATVHQPPKPVAPISLFSCRDVAVPPFSWEAPEDTVFMESEKEKGRDVPSHPPSLGSDLAGRMAVCLKEKGANATAVSVNTVSLQEQVDILGKQGYSCVLLGRMERFEERIGSGWSVNRPASVAFKVLLMETSTGRVIWRGSFDEAQQPLSENLFTLKRFVMRKARWVTAGELAESGFRSLVAAMVRIGARPLAVDEPPGEEQ